MSTESAPQAVSELIARAEALRASDVHLHMNAEGAEVQFRLDGVMTPVTRYPKELAERIFGRIKFLARLKTYQDSLPQDGRIDKGESGAGADIRVATYPTVTGEKIVLRFFASENPKGLEEIGLPRDVVEALESALGKTSGLVMLTGPAGSGKTTTIYAGLNYLMRLGGRHIITVEDPVEQVIPGVMQTEVNEARGLNFATAARHLLRQDPQVLVLGEIRDEDTARIAVRAASTGHLVMTTLHAGSCRGVLERLLLLCPDAYSVVSSLELILNQRLVRRVCPECKGGGCDHCLESGFRGRLPLVEFVRFDEEARRIARQPGWEGVRPKPSLEERAQGMIEAGLTTRQEVERVLGRWEAPSATSDAEGCLNVKKR